MTKTTTKAAGQTMEMPKEAPPPQLPAAPRISHPLNSGGRLAPIVPESFEQAWRMAQVIAKAGMAPKAYIVKNPVDLKEEYSVERICLAIMHGLEVGLTPMASIQSMAVINGMPTIYGDGMTGLIMASGLLEDIEETMEFDGEGAERLPMIAVCRVKRVGIKTWFQQEITRAQAQKARWWGKAGPWTDTPHRMMQWRAKGWCFRDAFPDILKGLITPEEAADIPLDVTPQGTDTTHDLGERPRRSNYAEQQEPDEPAHRGGGEPADRQDLDREAAEGWPLIDEVGETIGEFPPARWVSHLENLMKNLNEQQQRKVIDNNRDAGLGIVRDCADQIAQAFAAGLTELFAMPTDEPAPQEHQKATPAVTPDKPKPTAKPAAPKEPTDEELRPQGAGQENIAKAIVALIEEQKTEDMVNRILGANKNRMASWSTANRAVVIVAGENHIDDIRDGKA